MRLCPLSTQVANDGTRFGCSAANSFRPLGRPRHRFDVKMSALADVWVRPSDEAIEFVASLARIDKLHPAARPLEQTSGDSFSYRGFRKRRCSQGLSCSTIRCGLLVFCPPQFLIFRWTSFFPLKGAFRANNRTLDEMVCNRLVKHRVDGVDVNGEVDFPKSRLVPSGALICDQGIRLSPRVQ